MLEEIKNKYKKKALNTTLGRIATGIMVIAFITFMIIMIEYAIPTKNINLIIKLGIIYFGVNILRGAATLFEDINQNALEKEIQADYREKVFIKLQKLK